MKHDFIQNRSLPGSALVRCVALVGALSASVATLNSASDIPASIRFLRPLHLDVKMRVDSQRDISLRLDPSMEPVGQQLDTHQMWKLDQIRREIPQKFRVLQNLFPRQIAEYLLREGVALPEPGTSQLDALAPNVSAEIATRIAERYLTEPLPSGLTEDQARVRSEFVSAAAAMLPAEQAALRPVLESCARYSDPDFGTAKKTSTFLALKKQYSPYKDVPMTVAGDTLILGGKVVTERLSADAAVAGRSAEQFAYARRAEIARDLAQWRAAQISGEAYAGTIKSFLNDPRLAEFTPEEVHRAYARIFGRDLKTDIAADRMAAKAGKPVTYLEVMASAH